MKDWIPWFSNQNWSWHYLFPVCDICKCVFSGLASSCVCGLAGPAGGCWGGSWRSLNLPTSAQLPSVTPPLSVSDTMSWYLAAPACKPATPSLGMLQFCFSHLSPGQYQCGFECENRVKAEIREQTQPHCVPVTSQVLTVDLSILAALPALLFESGVSLCFCKHISNHLQGFLMQGVFQALLSLVVPGWWRLANGADTPLESEVSHCQGDEKTGGFTANAATWRKGVMSYHDYSLFFKCILQHLLLSFLIRVSGLDVP